MTFADLGGEDRAELNLDGRRVFVPEDFVRDLDDIVSFRPGQVVQNLCKDFDVGAFNGMAHCPRVQFTYQVWLGKEVRHHDHLVITPRDMPPQLARDNGVSLKAQMHRQRIVTDPTFG
jgi:hypothetical protein